MNHTRRSLLATWLTCAALTACGNRSQDELPPPPVAVDRNTTCSLDGMLLADYRGPKAQLFVAGQDQPVFFCDTTELFSTLLAGEQQVHVRAVYVQDMARTDWEQPRGQWFDARQGYFVIGSRRPGPMGPTIASFAAEADASKFAAEYGGKLLRYADITAAMVDLSGGALHDQRM